MSPTTRRVLIGTSVAALVLLASVASALRGARRQLAELEALLATTSDASAPREPGAGAAEESFTFDLQTPRGDIQAFGMALEEATEDIMPGPPPALAAWLDTNEAEVDALARRVLETGPIALTEIDTNVISSRNSTRHVFAVARAASLLQASAAHAAHRGDLHRANQRLEAAWILGVSLRPLAVAHGVSGYFLGAVRQVKPDHPGLWIERLDSLDVRAEAADRLALQARETIRTVEGVADWPTPKWMPRPLAFAATRITMARQAWIQCPRARGDLDAREFLLAQDGCDDPAALAIALSAPPSPGILSWFPAVRRGAARERGLADAADLMTDLHLTRHVLAARAGIADPGARGGPRFETTVLLDGRLHIAAVGPSATASFTFRPEHPHQE